MLEFNISQFNKRIHFKSKKENLIPEENILEVILQDKYQCWAKIDTQKFSLVKNGKKIYDGNSNPDVGFEDKYIPTCFYHYQN